ncbi:hypothetical protein BRDCF_p1479 [Bacteroidales bacterium CF]|jgi:hypothetical protein|nr:hypothetical protein BRDCF_p1479 [Bacteroidales bacterium CF]
MNILIVYCGHDTNTSANGVCVWNIAKELKSRGHEIWVIWQYENDKLTEFIDKGIHCYGIRESWYYKATKFFSRHRNVFYDTVYRTISLLRFIYVIPYYPNISPVIAMKCRKLAKKIVDNANIDKVLGIYLPYDAISTSIALKLRYKERLHVTNYHLDLISSPINTNMLIRKFKVWKGNIALKREFKIVDQILLPESFYGHIKCDKIKYVGFPLFLPNPQIEPYEFTFPKDCINVSYIGSLDSVNRNPNYILNLIFRCSVEFGKKIMVHIWGGLADEETIATIQKYENVIYYGVVENKFVRCLLENSDILLNVSNAVTYNMIPSKIFQMFSTHKPIINVVKHPEDCSIRYFSKYPNSINIREYRHTNDKNVQELNNWIDMMGNSVTKVDESLFIKSTPQYICNLIDGRDC